MKYLIGLILAAITYLFYGKQKAEQQLRANKIKTLKVSIQKDATKLLKMKKKSNKKREKYEEALDKYNTRYRSDTTKG